MKTSNFTKRNKPSQQTKGNSRITVIKSAAKVTRGVGYMVIETNHRQFGFPP